MHIVPPKRITRIIGMEQATSRYINLVKPLLMIMVIINHCTGNINLTGGGSLYIFAQITLGKVLTLSATSMFFLISGYLFFNNVELDNEGNGGVILNKLKKRVKSLVIPYFLWNGLAVLIVSLFSLYSHSSIDYNGIKDVVSQFWCSRSWNTDTKNILGQVTPMYAPIDIPLWYLRDLIVVTICSPLILLLIKYLDKWLFAILIPLFVLNIWTMIPGFTIQAFLFWSFGAFLVLKKKDICISLPVVLRCALYIITLGFMVWSVVQYYNNDCVTVYNILWRLFTVLMVICFLTMSPLVLKVFGRIPKVFVDSTFFTYAFHAFPLFGPVAFLGGLESKFGLSIVQTLCYVVIPIIIYAICTLCYVIIKRIVPRTTKVLVGGR